MRVGLCTSAVVWFATGCGEAKQAPPPPERGSAASPVGDQPAIVEPPAFPKGTRSLVLTRTVMVRLEPGEQARGIGAVAVDTRVGWTRTAKAKGCSKPWVEITPRGWVCGDYLETSTRPVLGREVPMLERSELVPGIYGKVTVPSSVTYVLEKSARKPGKAKPQRPITSPSQVESPPEPKMIEGKPLVGSVNVRQYEELTIGGKTYWKINQKQNEYVLRSAIAPHRPSTYGGIRLGDETGRTVPVGFVWARWGGGNVHTTHKPSSGMYRKLAHKTPITILETASDKTGKPIAYRIGDDEWLAAADARVFQPAPAPPMLLPGERWIDVDLDNQILVAFEGDMAVYATLVSSGTKDTPTQPGVYRMWLKQSEADMNGLSGEDPYSVATVPWTQFFSPDKGLALHTAYWHDGFGTQRSHGCINLAPRDARWLYFWSDPQVPPGWTSATGITEAPGSIVRVRTKDEPAPPAQGYAKKVLEARQAGRSG
ncbi:MAG: L,D-transpeptidase [Kofleriaceae bacterium]